MAKHRILFYTDCYVFAGCEKPMYELLSSKEFASRYQCKVVYRKSEEYDRGFSYSYPSFKWKTRGVRLPEHNTIAFYIEKKIKNPLLLKIIRKTSGIMLKIISFPIYIIEVFILWNLFLHDSAQIVHINNGGYPGALSCRSAALAAKLSQKKKIVFSVHNIALEHKGLFDRFVDFFVRRSVDLFITGSKASGQELFRARGFELTRIKNIYHGLKPLDVSRNLSDEYKSDILMVAAMEERKGYAYVIYALRKLIDSDPAFKDIKVLFIGGGPISDSVDKMVKEQNLERNIRLLGYRKDYPAFMASTKMLLNPSIGYEDLPLAVMEAMSLGIPVIGTDVAGIPEEIEHDVSGIIVKPKDIKALTEAIKELLLDDKKRTAMGSQGRRIFSEKFTVDKMVANYMRLYEEMGV